MTDAIAITIPGKPIPMPRPRATIAKIGRVGVYNPRIVKDWKEQIQPFVNQAMAGREPFPGPVELSISFFFKPLKNWPKKKKERVTWHTARPDIDNLLKMLLDALEGSVYHCDSQVSRVTADKLYAGPKDKEGILVDIYPLEDG